MVSFHAAWDIDRDSASPRCHQALRPDRGDAKNRWPTTVFTLLSCANHPDPFQGKLRMMRMPTVTGWLVNCIQSRYADRTNEE